MTHLSDDGKWTWDGNRWSATYAVVTGSIIARALAWTLLGGLPLGALVGLLLGLAFSRVGSSVGALAVVTGVIASEVVVIRIVMRRTPRISIKNGRMWVGRVAGAVETSGIPVQDVTRIEMVRGSTSLMLASEGAGGEGRVLIHLAGGSPIVLGWDAFASQSNTLAWLLGVPLIDPVMDARREREAADQVQNPGRDQRRIWLTNAVVIIILMVVLALLFGPLLMSLLHIGVR